MMVFCAFAKIPDVDCWACRLSVTATTYLYLRLTTNVPSVMRVFCAFAKILEVDCWACRSSVTATTYLYLTHWGILFWSSHVGLCNRRGEPSMGYRSSCQSGGWSRNLAFMGSLINDDLSWTFTLCQWLKCCLQERDHWSPRKKSKKRLGGRHG